VGKLNPANRAKAGRFQKGVSGNPSGRPKTPEWFKEHSAEAQAKILELMHGDDEKVALQAATLILAYSFGKPTEHMEHGVSSDLREMVMGSIKEKSE
jgi:hypothetical protein